MNDKPAYSICVGFSPTQRDEVVWLYWDAFKDKLGLVMKPELKALEFLEMVADPDHAISAIAPCGTLLGIAGYKTKDGNFIGGDLKELRSVYGRFGGLWRGLFLSLLERQIETGVLLMDGIFVRPSARSQGVGSALLIAIKEKAASLGCSKVRLDVIDINPRARALYERQGFIAGKTSDIGPLRYIFGFRKTTTMTYHV